MSLASFEIRDPERLVIDVAERVELTEDTAYAVLVRAPSVDQEILEVRRLELPALLDDDEEISEDLRALARSFRLPEAWPPQHAVVTVVVRPGRCLFGPNEHVWLAGWRYANHFQPLHDSDMILVTEHGWAHCFSDFAGHHPRMLPAE